MLDALPKRQASAERTAEGQEAVPELEAVWQETAEDHLGAAFIQPGDSVIVK